jgi:hypothetical protein
MRSRSNARRGRRDGVPVNGLRDDAVGDVETEIRLLSSLSWRPLVDLRWSGFAEEGFDARHAAAADVRRLVGRCGVKLLVGFRTAD